MTVPNDAYFLYIYEFIKKLRYFGNYILYNWFLRAF